MAVYFDCKYSGTKPSFKRYPWNKDTSVYRTLHKVPMVSIIEGFHCIQDTSPCPQGVHNRGVPLWSIHTNNVCSWRRLSHKGIELAMLLPQRYDPQQCRVPSPADWGHEAQLCWQPMVLYRPNQIERADQRTALQGVCSQEEGTHQQWQVYSKHCGALVPINCCIIWFSMDQCTMCKQQILWRNCVCIERTIMQHQDTAYWALKAFLHSE